ncbi:MAG: AraC family transcriptional regulator [Lentisphaerae bacterium]|nr:AraC family transcriptional regulator [Lentisphaerota bacterium]
MAIIKNIEINPEKGIHRVVARMPEFSREYGFWIVSGGIGNVTAPDSFENLKLRVFDFYSLSQMYGGHGKLELNGVVRDVEPGNMVLICPGEYHRYGGSDGNVYMEDSICFCGNIADVLRKKGVIRSGLYRGKPVRVVKQLVEAARDPSFNSGLRAALGLQELLVDLYESSGNTGKPIDVLLETIRKAPPEHWWRVTELAELIGVSTDTLRREFLRATGLLPKAYIEQLKLRQAAEMLLTEKQSISEIAMHFGYRDCYHFSRRFKFVLGLSPANYRAAMKVAH